MSSLLTCRLDNPVMISLSLPSFLLINSGDSGSVTMLQTNTVFSDQEMKKHGNQQRRAKGEMERQRTQDDPNNSSRADTLSHVSTHWKGVSSSAEVENRIFTSLPTKAVMCCS